MRAIQATILVLGLALAGLAGAESLPAPESPVLLTVKGLITHSNGDGRARFDRAMLDRLPQHGMTTTTPWTDGQQRFEGPLLSDLLARVGQRGDQLVLRALNDYYAVIDINDIAPFPVMLVMRVNGRMISVREKGPLWLLYPMSDYPQLDTPQHHAKMVWQLSSIEVR